MCLYNTYQSCISLHVNLFLTQGWYQGGGYIFNFDNTYQSSEHLLNQLVEANWIDQYTRVIIAEFSVWNPNTNLFSFLTISFEFIETGSMETWKEIKSVELYRFVMERKLLYC